MPKLSARPTTKDVNPAAKSISALSPIELEDFKFRTNTSKEEKLEIQEIERRLEALKNASTVKEILQHLSNKFRPSDQARKQELIQRGNILKSPPRDRMILPWLDEWESVFEEAKDLKLTVAKSPQAQYDFLFVARTIDQAWATANLVALGLDLEYDRIISDFPGYLKEFRQHQRINEIFSRNTENYPNSTSSSGVFVEVSVTQPWKACDLLCQQGLTSAFGKMPLDVELREQNIYIQFLCSTIKEIYQQYSFKSNIPLIVFTASNEIGNHNKQSDPSTIHKGRKQNGDKVCLCGKNHLYERCFYINFTNTKCPSNFTYRKEIFDSINKNFRPSSMGNLRKKFETKFGYNPVTTPSEALKSDYAGFTQKQFHDGPHENQMGSFTTILGENAYENTSPLTIEQESSIDFHLKDHWVLDSGSDVHICNNENLHQFQQTEIPSKEHHIISGTTKYPVAAWGSCKGMISPDKEGSYITLNKVALIPGFMTNLISLRLMNTKGVHWNTLTPLKMFRSDGSYFCRLFQAGRHWTFEKKPVGNTQANITSSEQQLSVFSGGVNRVVRHKTFDKVQLHRIFGHPSPEVVDHIADAAREGSITVLDTKPATKTLQCETCALSKAHKFISRCSDKEHPQMKPFERLTLDLIPMRERFNSNTQIIYFQCAKTLFNMVFTMYTKSESSNFTRKAIQLIKSTGYHVKYIHLDGESTLQRSLDDLAVEEGLRVERTAPNTPEQNGQSEVNGRWIILKARSFAIEANIPQNLCPQLVVTVGYIMNRTPSKKLSWKTPFESVYGYKPPLSHLDIIGSKVYALNKNIPRLDKLLSRAHIGYLVGWESTNIYKVWIPSLKGVINSRDVMIDSGNLYNPQHLDAIAIKEMTEQEIVKALEWPSLVQNKSSDQLIEDISDDSDTIIPIQLKIHMPSKSAIKLEKKGHIDDIHLPGVFPEEIISTKSNIESVKGNTYVDKQERQLPSSTAMCHGLIKSAYAAK
ncbi:hypothetical protein K3495_g5413 [Podosphaera aphanis]|nr:hypothetical protein K3495_g5413 [Podosphaera aphanis]